MDALMCNIYLTGDCTRKCTHCYYPKSHDKMTHTMARKIVDWLVRIYINDKVKLFKIHFLGGEPFLNFEILCYIMECIKEFKPEYTKPHPDGEFVVFTNGDYLEDEKLRHLKLFNTKIMLNPCNDSLENVEEKIIKIHGILHGCSLAIMLDDFNLNRLGELTELALKHRCHIRTNRLYHGGTIPGYVERYKVAMTMMFNKLLKSDWVMWPNFVMESTYPLWEGPKNPHACGRWFLAIDRSGDIRSCNADMSTVCGNINTHFSMQDFHFLHRWSSKNLEECKGCQWANGGLCQGGCPYTRKLAFGDYNHKTPFCSAFKELFPRLMELKEKYNGMGI